MNNKEQAPEQSNEAAHAYNVSVCAEIGGIADCNSKYTAGLSRRIAETDKAIEALTVGELLEIHKSYGDRFCRQTENEKNK